MQPRIPIIPVRCVTLQKLDWEVRNGPTTVAQVRRRTYDEWKAEWQESEYADWVEREFPVWEEEAFADWQKEQCSQV